MKIPSQYFNQEMIVPEAMKAYVLEVMAPETKIPVKFSETDSKLVIMSGDALKWIKQDFITLHNHFDLKSLTFRKIIFYLAVLKVEVTNFEEEKKEDDIGNLQRLIRGFIGKIDVLKNFCPSSLHIIPCTMLVYFVVAFCVLICFFTVYTFFSFCYEKFRPKKI